jgi:hypothetical protein
LLFLFDGNVKEQSIFPSQIYIFLDPNKKLPKRGFFKGFKYRNYGFRKQRCQSRRASRDSSANVHKFIVIMVLLFFSQFLATFCQFLLYFLEYFYNRVDFWAERFLFHLHESHVQKAIKKAVNKAKLTKKVTANTFRHYAEFRAMPSK